MLQKKIAMEITKMQSLSNYYVKLKNYYWKPQFISFFSIDICNIGKRNSLFQTVLLSMSFIYLGLKTYPHACFARKILLNNTYITPTSYSEIKRPLLQKTCMKKAFHLVKLGWLLLYSGLFLNIATSLNFQPMFNKNPGRRSYLITAVPQIWQRDSNCRSG